MTESQREWLKESLFDKLQNKYYGYEVVFMEERKDYKVFKKVVERFGIFNLFKKEVEVVDYVIKVEDMEWVKTRQSFNSTNYLSGIRTIIDYTLWTSFNIEHKKLFYRFS